MVPGFFIVNRFLKNDSSRPFNYFSVEYFSIIKKLPILT